MHTHLQVLEMREGIFGHGFGSDGSEGVVVKIDVTHVGIFRESFRESVDTGMIYPILRHLYLLESADTAKGFSESDGSCINTNSKK